MARATGVTADQLVAHDSGDVVTVGEVAVELLHTPGHTPGSQCFLVDGRLVSGDTLFLEGCGRTDLPGSDPEAMYESLTTRLARVPDDAVVFPGHLYSAEPSAPMGETRRTNFVFRPRSAAEWLAMFGGCGEPRSPGAGVPLAVDGTVVVVGASLAGLRAVQGLRDEGFTGRLVLVGEELHYPYDRPPLSKQVLAGTWPPERAVLADYHRLHDLGVEVRVGPPGRVARRRGASGELDDGTVVEADGVVMATGARPRHLPGTEGLEGVTVLRTLDDCEALRARLLAAGPGCRVVVVGAGFIGSEVASTCAEPRVPGDGGGGAGDAAWPRRWASVVGAACGALHVRHGVELRTGVGVARVHPPGADGEAGRRHRRSGRADRRDVARRPTWWWSASAWCRTSTGSRGRG